MIANGMLCYQLFASIGAVPLPYAACPYTDNAPYASTFNPGLSGPLGSLVWTNSTSGILPTGSFCECASGYGDPQGAGYCVPISGSATLATVDPLVASPSAVLQTTSVLLKNNILSFAITSPFTVGRNVSWFFAASAPSYTPSSMSTGAAWQLSYTNNLFCKRPGLFDVSLNGTATPMTQDYLYAALDWNIINSNRTGNVSQCGFTATVQGTQYVNSAVLTVLTSDLIPNTTLTRQSAATYPVRVTAPRTVTVSSSSINVNSTIALTAATVNLLYVPATQALSIVLQTRVAAPYILSALSSTPPSGLLSGSPSWILNDLGQCSSSAPGTPCVQQWIFNATANLASLCPATAPQQGTLNGAYTFAWNVATRNGNASIPSSSATVNVQTQSICTAITVGVVTQASLMPYSDPSFVSAVPTLGFVPGQRTYWQIVASSAQVSVMSVRINQIWFGPTALIVNAVNQANVTYATGSSNIAYPATTTSYPQVRMLWDYSDAQNCLAGTSGYPLTPNMPAAAGATLASCPAFSSPGAGVVQSPWLTSPAASPETLYPNGTTLLGVSNRLSVVHQVNSGGAFTAGISSALASFAHDNSIYITGNQPINSPNATNATLVFNYSACNASLNLADPCQKYMYLMNANTFAQYAYAVSLTVTYAGTTATSQVHKRNLIVTNTHAQRGNDDGLLSMRIDKRGPRQAQSDESAQKEAAPLMQVRDYYSSQQDNSALMSSEIGVNSGSSSGNSGNGNQSGSSSGWPWSSYGFTIACVSFVTAFALLFFIIVCCRMCFKRWRRGRNNDYSPV